MKKAILVEVPFMVRLIVDENTTEKQIVQMTAIKLQEKLNNDEVGDNIYTIEDDDECPYGTFEGEEIEEDDEDYLSSLMYGVDNNQ